MSWAFCIVEIVFYVHLNLFGQKIWRIRKTRANFEPNLKLILWMVCHVFTSSVDGEPSFFVYVVTDKFCKRGLLSLHQARFSSLRLQVTALHLLLWDGSSSQQFFS